MKELLTLSSSRSAFVVGNQRPLRAGQSYPQAHAGAVTWQACSMTYLTHSDTDRS